MERSKYILVIIAIAFCLPVKASYKSEIYFAYIQNKMDVWKSIIDEMESQDSKNNLLLLELVNYQYGYIAWCIGVGNKIEAKEYLKKANANIDFLLKENYELSKVYAYKSAFIGYEIGLNNYKAPFIGYKSTKFAESSVELDPNNYFAVMQLANIDFFMPVIIGGSKQKALVLFKKALSLYEMYIGDENDWNYLNLLSAIIMTYIELEDYVKAKEFCEMALDVEPSFLWVKDELYPLVREKNIK